MNLLYLVRLFFPSPFLARLAQFLFPDVVLIQIFRPYESVLLEQSYRFYLSCGNKQMRAYIFNITKTDGERERERERENMAAESPLQINGAHRFTMFELTYSCWVSDASTRRQHSLPFQNRECASCLWLYIHQRCLSGCTSSSGEK